MQFIVIALNIRNIILYKVREYICDPIEFLIFFIYNELIARKEYRKFKLLVQNLEW